MKLSLCLSLAAGVAAAVGSAQAQQTVYFNSGRSYTVLNAGTAVFLGFSGGTLPSAGFTQRWSAQPFTIAAGGADLGEIDVDGFLPAGAEPVNMVYIIWSRTAGSPDPAPVAANQLFTGTMATPVPIADARVAGTNQGEFQLILPSTIHLNAGNYWLTVYGDVPLNGSGADANFAWYGNAQVDPDYWTTLTPPQPVNTPIVETGANGVFMYRSTAFPTPGFAQYMPATITVDPAPTSGPGSPGNSIAAQNPNYLFSQAFRLKSAPPIGACCKADGTCSQQISAACTAAGGLWQGAGITCAAAGCPAPGACCMADGSCQQMAASACESAEGVYRGNNTTCASGACGATGACCQMDGTCAVVNEATCRSVNGLYHGAGSACASANCPTTYNYPGDPITINDAVGTTCGAAVVAELTVNDSFTVAGADVSMFVTHTFQGDLQLWLKHVQTGTIVRVVNQPPAGAGTYSADNYGGANIPDGWFRLIDSAPNFYRTSAVPFGIPPATGLDGVHWQWKPENPLSAATPAGFAGENSAGQWQLIAQDCGPGDTGNIENWALTLQRPGAAVCYANCDASTVNPFLNVADFTCFLQKYAAGSTYANCDNSTQPPTLNVADFTCFLQKFAAGCSAP